MEKISVIIPVYNVAHYLSRCLDSVINQTYCNLEILVIDDGSTDNSATIISQYAHKDTRIRTFNKTNGGLSSARNVGLQNITGQYVGFVDSDDWIEPRMYEILYNRIKDKNTQIAISGFYTSTDDSSFPRINKSQIPDDILSAKDMMEYIFRLDIYNAFHIVVWNKLYNADVFNKHGCTFNENIKFSEDVIFTPNVLFTKNCTGTYIHTPLYHYYQRSNSLMRSKSVKNKFDALQAFDITISQLNEKGYNSCYAKKEHCFQASLIASLALEIGDLESFIKAQKAMKKYFQEYENYTLNDYPERLDNIVKLINHKFI